VKSRELNIIYMEPIEEGRFYHIYNHAAGNSDLFMADDEYRRFVQSYFYYLYVCVETYAWCLLRNHFHILIRVRTNPEQAEIFQVIKKNYPEGCFYGDHFTETKPYAASQQFAHLFNSFTKQINRKQDKHGTLIQGPFKRKRVVDEANFHHLVCYIHRNPIHHRIMKSYTDYQYSSYCEILGSESTFLERDNLLTMMGGRENFIEAHREFKEKLDEKFYLE